MIAGEFFARPFGSLACGIALILAMHGAGAGPGGGAAPTAVQPANLFDFWLGDWTVTWKNPDGSPGKGRNHVERTLDGLAIEEHFEADPGGPPPILRGRSLSVRQKASGLWRQAWVDNEGSFFCLTAALDGERRIFATELVPAGAELKGQRMVFHDIQRDEFVWDWEGTTDGGKHWKLLWQLHYHR